MKKYSFLRSQKSIAYDKYSLLNYKNDKYKYSNKLKN